MRILNIICSPNGSRSKSQILSTKIIEQMTNKIDVTTINLYEMDIKFCIGCSNCFKTGICKLDEMDDMGYIKETILKSNIIIVSLPVYTKFIPSKLKMLFERTAGWAHSMELISKYVIFIVNAASSGIEKSIEYLYEISLYYGLVCIGIVRSYEYVNKKTIHSQIMNCVDNINLIKNKCNVNIYSNLYLNKVFHDFNIIYSYVEDDSFEKQKWFKNKFYLFHNFDDAVRYIKKED